MDKETIVSTESVFDAATPDQMQRANDAVEQCMNADGTPKWDSAQGYACALSAIIQSDTRPSQPPVTDAERSKTMTDDQIKHMVSRFLSWRLPEHFSPDAGISFAPEFNVEWNAKQGKAPQRHEPVGTNLFSADQAEAMVRHMVEQLP